MKGFRPILNYFGACVFIALCIRQKDVLEFYYLYMWVIIVRNLLIDVQTLKIALENYKANNIVSPYENYKLKFILIKFRNALK